LLDQILSRLKRRPSSKDKDRGDKLRDDRLYSEAAEYYISHLKKEPNDFDIWVQAGNCLKEAKSFERAKAAYEAALQLNPTNSDLHLQIGHLAKMMNDNAAAVESYRVALDLDGSSIAAASELEQISIASQEVFPIPQQQAVYFEVSLVKSINLSKSYSTSSEDVGEHLAKIKDILISR